MRAILFLLYTGCSAHDTDLVNVEDVESDGGVADTEVERLDGATVFQRRCATCHGTAAQGTTAGYELRHPPRPYSEWVIRQGRPGPEFPRSNMPAWGDRQLNDTQLSELFDWLDAFERPTSGAGLFLDLCASCHGRDGAAGVVGMDVRGWPATETRAIVRAGSGADDFAARRRYMPSWDVDQLTDRELDQIAAWLAATR